MPRPSRSTSRSAPTLRRIAQILEAISFIAALSCLVLLTVYVGFDHEQAHIKALRLSLRAIQWIFISNILFNLVFRFRQTRHDTRWLKWIVDIFMLLTLLPVLYPHPENPWIPWLEQLLYSRKFLYAALTSYSVLDISFMLMRLTGRRTNPSLLLATSFLLFITIGSLVLMMPRCTYHPISFSDSFFVSTSAVCICGLSPVNIAETFTPLGQTALMVMFEIGGLGLITFTSFFAIFFSGRQSVYNQLLVRDIVYSKTMNALIPTLLYILAFTVCIQIAGAVAIYLTLPDAIAPTVNERLRIAVFHSVSGFCNVGMSNIPDGMSNSILMRTGNSLYVVMSILVFAGSIGFPILVNFKEGIVRRIRQVWRRIRHRNRGSEPLHIYDVNTKITLITTSIIFIIGFAGFWILESGNTLKGMDVTDCAVQSLFNAVMPRSGGFMTVSPASFMSVTLLLVVAQMWIGGGSQSTAGGIKVNTFGTLFLNLRSVVTGTRNVTAFRRRIAYQSVRRANAVTFLSILTVIAFAVTLLLMEPDIPAKSIVFETFSATFNVGSSMGATAELSDASKAVVCVAMFVGRVGLVSLLTGALAMRRDASGHYPEDDVIIS